MENFELFRLEWPVHKDGYTIKGKTKQILPVGKDVVMYNPLEHSGLFHDFAAVPQTEAGILEFANKYGLLRDTTNYVEQWVMWNKLMNAFIKSIHSKNHNKQALENVEKLMQVWPRFDPDTLNIQFWPDSLLAAMFLQLGLAVSGDKTFRQCVWCGSTFEITPSVARSNRLFCSNACKQADYRHRKKGK
jgi:hypothetical protein